VVREVLRLGSQGVIRWGVPQVRSGRPPAAGLDALHDVAVAAILAAVEGGILPPGNASPTQRRLTVSEGGAAPRRDCELGSTNVRAGRTRSARTPTLPPGWKPGSTAGRRPAATVAAAILAAVEGGVLPPGKATPTQRRLTVPEGGGALRRDRRGTGSKTRGTGPVQNSCLPQVTKPPASPHKSETA